MANAMLAEQSFLLSMGMKQNLVSLSGSLIADFRFSSKTIHLMNLMHDLNTLLNWDYGYNEQRVIHMAIMSCNLDLLTNLVPGFDWEIDNKVPMYYWDHENEEIIISKEYRLELTKLHLLPMDKLKELCVTHQVSSAKIEHVDMNNYIHEKRTKIGHGD